MNNIAIFASGSGTNAENIIKYFSNNPKVTIAAVFTNNVHAGVIDRAKKLNITYYVFSKNELNSGKVLEMLLALNINFIVLAGFLLLIPKDIIRNFKNKIINIHPALLPKFGGKGMYGDNVHKAVIENNETESGITIHYVNELYDNGDIIFNAKCKVEATDNATSLAAKIHKLEYKYFSEVIEKLTT